MIAPDSFFARHRQALVVWSVWFVMLVAGLYFVFAFCSDVPYGEEWECVPQMARTQPLTFAFLWEQITDHRMPLNKLMFVLLGRWTNGDLRIEKILNLFLLAAIAAFLILTARRLRGRTHFADAFFPLALLHWGHWEVFLMAFLFQFIISTGLALVVLAAIICQPLPSMRRSLLAAVCLLLLPLLGTNGLIFVPPLGLWLFGVAISHWRSAASGQDRRRVAGLFALIGLAAIFCLLYVAGYQKPAGQPPSLGWRAITQTSLQFLGMSIGSAGKLAWPYATEITLAILLATLGRIAWLWRKNPEERIRLAGLALFFAAIAIMAYAVGKGRSSFGFPSGFASRYSLLALPALVAAYFTWAIRPPRFGRALEAAFCLAMAGLLYPDLLDAIPHAMQRRHEIALFKSELERGVSSERLAEHHRFVLYPFAEHTAERLEILRAAAMGPFRDQRPGDGPRLARSSSALSRMPR